MSSIMFVVFIVCLSSNPASGFCSLFQKHLITFYCSIIKIKFDNSHTIKLMSLFLYDEAWWRVMSHTVSSRLKTKHSKPQCIVSKLYTLCTHVQLSVMHCTTTWCQPGLSFLGVSAGQFIHPPIDKRHYLAELCRSPLRFMVGET